MNKAGRPAAILLLLCAVSAAAVSADNNEASASPYVSDLLQKTRRSVETFWNQFRSVTCLETVTREKLRENGKTEYRQKSTFDYLAILNSDEKKLSVEESRLQQGKKPSSRSL